MQKRSFDAVQSALQVHPLGRLRMGVGPDIKFVGGSAGGAVQWQGFSEKTDGVGHGLSDCLRL